MSKDNLTAALEDIGFRLLGGRKNTRQSSVDIETVLFEATLASSQDSRLFSVLCSWVGVHGDKVIIEKLMKKQKNHFSPWLVALAVFAESKGLHPWKRLIVKLPQELFFVSKSSAESQIARKGSFPGMHERNILIANNEIRDRPEDVFTKEELIKANRQYRNRFIYGSCIRSDIISLIEEGFPNPYQIAKKIGCSEGPAYRIFKEFQMAQVSSN